MALPPELPQLSGVQWRCLRVVCEFPDLAHAARRLHCSQPTLKEMLSDLMARLGAQHIHVDAQRVHLSEALKNVIEYPQPLCRPTHESLGPGMARPGMRQVSENGLVPRAVCVESGPGDPSSKQGM